MSYDRPRGYYAQKAREADDEITTNVWTIYVSSQKCQWCDQTLYGEGHSEDESRERLRKKRQLHFGEDLCPGFIPRKQKCLKCGHESTYDPGESSASPCPGCITVQDAGGSETVLREIRRLR